MDVTAIGDVNVDLLSSFTPSQETAQQIKKIRLKVGGGAANFAIQLANLGLKVKLIGSVGNDWLGRFVLWKLKRAGIKTCIKVLEEPTGITIGLQLRNGKKLLITQQGSTRAFSLNHFKLEDLEGCLLHLAGYNLLDSLRKDFGRIAGYAKLRGMVVSLDPDLKAGIRFNKKTFFKILNSVDILFLDEEEAKLLGKNPSWLARKVKLVVIRGKQSCLGIERGKRIRMDSKKVKAKTSVGAGDVFDASFLHHYLYGYELVECLEFARAKCLEYLLT